MKQINFLDLANRYEKLSKQRDPLERLDGKMNWRIFEPLLNRTFDKERRSAAGRKAFDRLMMFKIVLLQTLYNLSDAQTEYQIQDRLSLMRFLTLGIGDTVPDEKTI